MATRKSKSASSSSPASPSHANVGFELANVSMSSNQSGEGDIRKVIIEADLVDCMVVMLDQPVGEFGKD